MTSHENESMISSSGGFSISSMTGNPSAVEIAALSSALSLWIKGLSSPVDIVVDNSVDILGIVRSMNRNPSSFSSYKGYFSNKTASVWALTHKVRSRN